MRAPGDGWIPLHPHNTVGSGTKADESRLGTLVDCGDLCAGDSASDPGMLKQ